MVAPSPRPIESADPQGSYERFARLAARLLAARVPPTSAEWQDSTGPAPCLFPSSVTDSKMSAPHERLAARVIEELGRDSELVACHTSLERWSLLYALAWRRMILPQGDWNILDADARRFELLRIAVKRDLHKMKAFVRFRRVEGTTPERYVAWHRPEHRIVRLAAPFFARRFGSLHWTIFTPHESVNWDGDTLTFGAGVPASEVRAQDALEDLWKTYYGSIFNPARIKIGAMVKEMPRRHWATLPETKVIDELLRKAPDRVKRMIAHGVDERGAEAFLPDRQVSLHVLRDAAAVCTGCGLGELASRTVFGEGPAPADVMLLGEQPGDEEDRAGRPFVGPAGCLLDDALRKAGLDRTAMYVTNAVKHFKFEPRGKRRIHQRPHAGEIRACRPWLDREIDQVRPRAILLLGATAGQSLLGQGYRVSRARRTWIDDPSGRCRLFATVHPSMILRTPPEMRASAFHEFVDDLRTFRDQLQASPEPA